MEYFQFPYEEQIEVFTEFEKFTKEADMISFIEKLEDMLLLS